MAELLPESLFSRLSRLSHLFVWRRKALHDTIVQELRAACQQHAALARQHDDTMSQIKALTSKQQSLNAEIAQLRETVATATQELAVLQTRYAEKKQALSVLERQHGDTSTRYDLVSRLLAARPSENPGLARFHALLEQDFMAFSEMVALKTEARALRMMQSIASELELLAGCPEVRQRSVVAIVGGFSSGKSEFINSFIDNPDIRLSVGIQPVTVIPGYVFAAKSGQEVIRGYCANHGHVDLDAAFYKGLSHAFIDTFSFDLRSLMPFVFLGVKMDPKYFGNLCFIDTPGYNPPAHSNDYSGGDRNTAVEFAQQANAIVWLIGLDATGTVPTSDIDFIHEIGHEKKKIYVVLNKADLKPDEEIEAIMDEVEDILVNEQGFEIEGICAYVSEPKWKRTRMAGYRKLELMDYFARINRPSDACEYLRQRLNEVFAMYEESLKADIARIRKHRLAVNGLKIDAMEIGGAELFERMADRIESLDIAVAEIKQLETALKTSRTLHKEFMAAVDLSLNGEVGITP